LEATDAIKSERAALKQLGLARKAANGDATARKRAIRILEKLVATYPDTEAAKTATDLLDSAGAGESNRGEK
jgi:TolA-binding protein